MGRDDSADAGGGGGGAKKRPEPKESNQHTATWGEVFMFATPLDWFLMIVGSVFAMIKGCLLPVMVVNFSSIMNRFVGTHRDVSHHNTNTTDLSAANLTATTTAAVSAAITYTLFGPLPTATCFDLANADDLARYERSNLLATQPHTAATDPLASWTVLPVHCRASVLDDAGSGIIQNVYNFLWIGLGTFISAYIHSLCWNVAAARQCAVMRREMFRAIMRQDIGWFDGQNTRRLPTQLAESVAKVHEGMQKIDMLFENVTGFATSFVIALIYGWELGLIVMAICPLIALGGFLMMRVSSRAASSELAAYSKAGAVAEETITNIRTVAALGCEQKQVDKYANNLASATTAGIRKGVAAGVGQGFMWAVIFVSYALAFGVGAWLVRRSIYTGDGRYTVGTILLVFFCVLVGAMQLGQVMPNLQMASNSRAAAYVVVAIVKRRPSIDSAGEGGKRPTPIKGKISFRDVSFRYPTRSEVQILDKLSLDIEPGTTVALVGGSGCGKSTLIQLVERFYDPDAGTVLLDDIDLRHWNVSHLRNVVGIVAQEPVLFETTIGENIRYGRAGVTQTEIEDACRKANIYDFINSLPHKFDTQVGQKGSQLSGGEKQRIAIARALLKSPAVLLLDEATSALDAVSERLVQQAIDMATVGSRRTVLVIAHRLSTIRGADRIVALKDGKVSESGTHKELMEKRGLYYALVQAQTNAAPETEATVQVRKVSSNDDDSGNGGGHEADEKPTVTTSGSSEGSDGGKTESTMEVQEYVDETINSKAVADTTGAILPVARGTTKIYADDATGTTVKGHRASNATVAPAAAGDEKKKNEVEEDIGDAQIGRLVRINAPEWWLIMFGLIGALCAGAIMPVYAVLLSEMLKVFAEPNLDKQASGATFWSCMFLVLGAVCFFSNVFQFSMLGVAGERLTTRLRKRVFVAIVRQDMEFFDWAKNNVGALTAKLATDAATVQAATGSALALILQASCTLIVAFAIGFYFAWKVVLVLLGTIQFVILGTFIESKLISGQAKGSQAALEKASSVVTEAIEQVRTVAMLNLESHFVNEFENRMRKANRDGIWRAFAVAAAFAFSQSVRFLAFALAFWAGWQFIRSSWLNDDEKVKFDFSDMLKALMGIMFGAISIGQASSFGQSFGKAKVSSARIFKLIDTVPKIDITDQGGLKPPAGLSGEIAFKSVRFRYPTRHAMPLLRGLTLQAHAGQSLALVGHSGCGKSTTIQLLERYYEPSEGEITIDGKSIKAYNLKWLRQQLGLVGQEPVLFGGTVRENIGYGCEMPPTDEEIIAAAKDANIHAFVLQLPQQYDTFLGDKGAQLSGGQKQRIAIARALIRKPRILLLDEATSALDTESEHVVQEALTRAMNGRTSITIAHRLNTIENCDAIAVIDKGRLAEFGTHKQLMQLEEEGLYYKAQNTLKGGAPPAARAS